MKELFILLFFQHAYGAVPAVPAVPTVRLNDGNQMPAIALGTWLGLTQGQRNKPTGHEVEDAVKHAIDAGYRHVDTAAIYQIEDQVGRGLRAKIRDGTVKREDVFVTSKLWNDKHKREQVVPALKESLRKLDLDYLDLYLIHWPFAMFSNHSLDNLQGFEETWRGMQDAKRMNLTRSIGLSNFNQQQIDQILALEGEKPAALQVEVNLNLQQPSLLEYAKRRNIVMMGYTPFGSLFPSKAQPDAPPPRVDDPKLVEIANQYNKTVPQVALKYLIELGVVPLPKSVTKSRIEQNIDVFDFQLSEQDRNTLRSFDRHYRTIDFEFAKSSPFYPFEK